MRVGVDVERVIGARLETRLAPDAALIIEVHHPVIPHMQCSDRTDSYAWRPLTMVAAHHGEQAPVVREGTLLNVLHPSPINANRHLVLTFARHCASMAADALAVID